MGHRHIAQQGQDCLRINLIDRFLANNIGVGAKAQCVAAEQRLVGRQAARILSPFDANRGRNIACRPLEDRTANERTHQALVAIDDTHVGSSPNEVGPGLRKIAFTEKVQWHAAIRRVETVAGHGVDEQALLQAGEGPVIELPLLLFRFRVADPHVVFPRSGYIPSQTGQQSSVVAFGLDDPRSQFQEAPRQRDADNVRPDREPVVGKQLLVGRCQHRVVGIDRDECAERARRCKAANDVVAGVHQLRIELDPVREIKIDQGAGRVALERELQVVDRREVVTIVG